MRVSYILMMLTFTDGGYEFFFASCGRVSDGWAPAWKLAVLLEVICGSSTS